MRRERELAPARELIGRDIVCFSNDWDGDPLSKTHLMRILARDNRVLWVSSLGNRSPRATAYDLRRALRKARAMLTGMREAEPNLHVLAPVALPWFGPAARLVNRALLRTQLELAMRRLRFRRPVSWAFLPAAATVVGTLGEDWVIYHCVDEFSAFADAPSGQIQELEERLARRADLVIASAESLRESKARWNPDAVLVRHGVDHPHFARALLPETVVPQEIAVLPRPVLGFFGLIAEWVDLDLVRFVADAFPQGSVVLLGKATRELGPLEGTRNVHWLGHRPYVALPSYCKGWDVALLPFRVNALTRHANPLKVREYLAAGLPVVATPIPEVASLGLCRIGATHQEFVGQIRAALAEGAGPSLARSQSMATESWEARVDEIRGHIAALRARRRNAAFPG